MLTTLIPLVALALASCAQGTGSGVATVDEAAQTVAKAPRVDVPADHPNLSEQEKLIACADCHRDTTPDLYDTWYASTHGIGNVKCYQCHGTYEDMKKVPAVSNCATCHADMMMKQTDAPACWTCHPAHEFNPHAE
jgi:hypothetical protein